TYLCGSHNLLSEVCKLDPLPPGAKLFTTNANPMYSNIDTDHAIGVIGTWLDSLGSQLPEDMVMNHYFHQLLGVAKGTSATCMWVTIYFWIHEKNLIPAYSNYTPCLQCFIDNMFWI
ncbi:hypothetical protein ACHAWF_001975, partial [Thalassiosira exigua]